MKRVCKNVELTWPGKKKRLDEARPLQPEVQFVKTEIYGLSLDEDPGKPPGESPFNRIYFCDNLPASSALHSELSGKIDFIYIDPPFCTGNEYHVLPADRESDREGQIKSTHAYSDCWEGGLGGYLNWLYPRLLSMFELLSPNGNLVIHLDWRAASHVRLLLDEIFGPNRLVNELIWYKGVRGTRSTGNFQRSHDVLWWYAKGKNYYWHQGFEPYKDPELKRYNRIDEHGRRYARIKRRRTDGTVYYGRTYPGGRGKRRSDVITDVPTMAATSGERTGFATQKPLRLLEILIQSLCPEGGIAGDFFCGTGTTLVAASKLNRRFIGVEQSPVGLHFTRKRLLESAGPPEFAVLRPNKKARLQTVSPAGLVRVTGDNSLIFQAGGPEGEKAFAFYAVDPHPRGKVLRAAWVNCDGRAEHSALASPSFPKAREFRVLLSDRNGNESWLKVKGKP